MENVFPKNPVKARRARLDLAVRILKEEYDKLETQKKQYDLELASYNSELNRIQEIVDHRPWELTEKDRYSLPMTRPIEPGKRTAQLKALSRILVDTKVTNRLGKEYLKIAIAELEAK